MKKVSHYRLIIEVNPMTMEIASHDDDLKDLDFANSVTINLKSIIILFSVGFIGIILFARRKTSNKLYEKDVTPN